MPQSPYAPTDFDPLVMEDFGGINTLTTRAGIPDEQMAWCDGFMPVARRNLRTLYGLGSAIWTAPVGTTIVKFYGGLTHFMVILSDGSLWFLGTDGSSPTQIGASGTISGPPAQSLTNANCEIIRLPNTMFIIVSQGSANGYMIYADQLYRPGQTVPGIGVVPSGVLGSTVASYQGRIWVANNTNLAWTAPGSIVDFSTASGGGVSASNDETLRSTYTRLIQSNGFLYVFGDSNASYISGVQTSGSPPTTTFTFQNADPETGTSWPSAVIVWGHDIMVPNFLGVHKLSGATINKVSYELDGVYNSATTPAVFYPSSAKSYVFGRKVFVLLLPIVDPVSNVQVNKLIMWDGKRWWTCPTSVTLTFITTLELNSNLLAYGTDGTSIYQLFAQAAAFTKTVRSKYWDKPGSYTHNKTIDRFWSLWNYYSASNPNITLTMNSAVIDRSTSQMSDTSTGYSITGPSATGSFVSAPMAVAMQGVLNGFTLTTQANDASLISAAIGPNVQEYRG